MKQIFIIHNTLIVWCKKITKQDIELFVNQPIFFIIAPFLEEIGSNTFQNMKNLIQVYAPLLQVIGSSAFGECHMLTKVFGNNIVTIGDSAFEDCYCLRDMCFDNVEKTGLKSARNCGFKTIKIPKPTNFEQVADLFQHQFQLENIDLPNMMNVDLDGINSCHNLGVIRLPKAIQIKNEKQAYPNVKVTADSSKIAQEGRYLSEFVQTDHQLDKQRVKEVLLHNISFEHNRVLYQKQLDRAQNHMQLKCICLLHTTEIPNNAFNAHYLLNDAFCPNVIKVGKFGFSQCLNLVQFYSKNLQFVGQDAFYYCNCLIKFSFEKVTHLSKLSFLCCNSLVNVDIPLVDEIPERCFDNCTGLLQIVAPNVKETKCEKLETIVRKKKELRFQELAVDEFKERKIFNALIYTHQKHCCSELIYVRTLQKMRAE
uniref:Leucine rich repeats-containing protein n=1 Tax=Trepomonas sp. PC1 TaxID=1076344 RepID=A0A146KG37_9EUKA|eukprot:JAP94361.1 Leucine rich repeats-containing protein [Trepomonas sp. PC1]